MTSPPAPALSVVLPVGAVEHYLPACLDSLLGEPDPPGGLEVVAVDDAAIDASGEILEARASADARLRVAHLPERQGPGAARNRGLALATGTYVWFADPDDLFPPGALGHVAAQLAAAPDLLLIDYRTLHPSGRTSASPGADLLAGQAGGGDEPLTLASRPALVNRTMTVWSKVFRREFLAGLDTPFPAGIHEDVPVSCAALLAARRIALLPEVCYLYRRRPGSLLTTPSQDHFQIFTSYHRVFGMLETAPLPAARCGEVRAAVFARAVEHYSSVLASGLVPRGARREFFRRMAGDFQRYRPPGYTPPAGPRGVKTALIARDSFWAYELLAPLNDARVTVARLASG